MQKLLKGLHQFKTEIFTHHKDLFDRLRNGQHPDTLFITCSDSRINPHLITQSNPGDLFIVRNAGNMVPPYGAVHGGEEASIEYAVSALGVKDIVVCGHSHCGAVKALLHPESVAELPAVSRWLSHAEPTRRIMKESYSHLSDDAARLLNVAIQENVLNQIENLRTHPAVASALSRGTLSIHAWVYKFETGDVFSYQPTEGQFLPIHQESYSPVVSRPRKLALAGG